MNSEYSFSSGYFSVPMKSICSRKWAIPYCAFGSKAEPTWTSSEAALFSA
jgi:hypothetical protein